MDGFFKYRIETSNETVFFVLIVIYLLFMMLQYYFPGRVQAMAIRMMAFQTHERDYGLKRSDEWIAQLLAGSVTALGFSVFMLTSMRMGGFLSRNTVGDFPLLILLIIITLLFGLTRYGIIKLLASAAGNESLSEQYFTLNTAFSFMLSLALVLLSIPITISAFDAIWWIGGGALVWALFFAFRVLKSALLGISDSGISFKYILLYICALEILPVAILAKFVFSRL
jgi:hypothetical protein